MPDMKWATNIYWVLSILRKFCFFIISFLTTFAMINANNRIKRNISDLIPMDFKSSLVMLIFNENYPTYMDMFQNEIKRQ